MPYKGSYVCWSVACMTLCHQEGQELIQEKPELRSVVQQKLEEIRECWSDLENTTKAKARQLFENNKPEPVVKSYSDLDSQLSNLEQQPPQLEQAHHLPTFNEQLQKFQASVKGLGRSLFLYQQPPRHLSLHQLISGFFISNILTLVYVQTTSTFNVVYLSMFTFITVRPSIMVQSKCLPCTSSLSKQPIRSHSFTQRATLSVFCRVYYFGRLI